MAIETFWAVRADVLQKLSAFRSRVNVSAEDLLYLDDQARVWGAPRAGGAPIYQDASREWRELCDQIIRPVARARPRLPLHRWNTNFEWTPLGRSLRLLDRQEAEFYDENGWVVLEDAVDPATVKRLVEESDIAEREGERKLRQMRGSRGFIARADEITFTTHLVNRAPFAREFYKSKLFQDIGHDFIGPDVRLYWDQAVYKKPGVEKPFPWHQDNGYTFVEPQNYITCWIGLDEATEENGCMWFVPGVHKLGTVAHDLTDLGYACYREDPPEAVPVPTRPGTVIVLSGLTPHKTAHNRTDKVRRALVAQFVPEGAVAVTEDAWGNVTRTVADRPDRQFKVLAGGAPCP